GAQARLLAADRDGAGGAAGAALPAVPRAAAAAGGARRGALPRWLPHVRGEPVRALGVPAGGGPGLALPLRVHALGAAPERHHDAAAAPAAGGGGADLRPPGPPGGGARGGAGPRHPHRGRARGGAPQRREPGLRAGAGAAAARGGAPHDLVTGGADEPQPAVRDQPGGPGDAALVREPQARDDRVLEAGGGLARADVGAAGVAQLREVVLGAPTRGHAGDAGRGVRAALQRAAGARRAVVPGADPAAGGLGGALLGAGPDPAYRQDPASRTQVRGLKA